MCKPSTPKYTPPPEPAPAPEAPKRIDDSVKQARASERSQAKLRTGRGGTILTSGLETEEANTARKTLLGT